MPFLLPAVTALISDVIVLYLDHVDLSDSDIGAVPHKWIYRVGYTLPLAIVRLLILVFPMPYHSYMGTAIKFQFLYRGFYVVSIVFLLVQMLAIIMYDPNSLTSLIFQQQSPQPQYNSTDTPDSLRLLQVEDNPIRLLIASITSTAAAATTSVHAHMRLIWSILILSLLSNLLHLLLLWHVRSSAPNQWYRKHILYYYARRQHLSEGDGAGTNNDNMTGDIMGTGGEDTSLLMYDEENHVYHPISASQSPSSSTRRRTGGPPTSAATNLIHSRLRKLVRVPEGYDVFMSQVQTRLETTKKQWSKRLEEFTHRFQDMDGAENSNSSLRFPQRVTPFSALLRLFAYENSALEQLDQVFHSDDSIFYVPQLLSFLLYNAFDTAPQLEEWILRECQHSVYFAHRCFWFLRAWCLEVGTMKVNSNGNSTDDVNTPNSNNNNNNNNSSIHSSSNQNLPSSTSHNSLASMMEEMSQKVKTKFPPEERSVMEGLLLRVVERGEIPAKILQYGTKQDRERILKSDNLAIDENDQDGDDCQLAVARIPMAANMMTTPTKPGSYMAAVQSGMLPMDRSTGYPSVGHLDALTAHKTFGFMPLPNVPLLMADDVFMATPRFLDALMQLADALFLVPRELRTAHMRDQLKVMETEWLPSNSIYLPLNRIHHRVWRISAEESIAISTKERVPCIICFEVVDFEEPPPQHQQQQQQEQLLQPQQRESELSAPVSPVPGKPLLPSFRSPLSAVNNMDSERAIVRQWRTAPRNPHRLDSFIHKVATFTENLRKIRGTTVVPDSIFWEQQQHQQEPDGIMKTPAAESPARPLPKRKISAEGLMTPVLDHGDDDNDGIGGGFKGTSLTQATSATTGSMGQWGSSPISNARRRIFSDRYRDRRDEFDYLDSGDLVPHHDNEQVLLNVRTNYMEGRPPLPPPPLAPQQQTATGETPSPVRARMPPVVFKESWEAKQERVRSKSIFGKDPNWRLMPILIKSNDDLRQEQLASQLIYRMATILAKEKTPVWLCPYEIVALTDRGGIIEAIPDTISIDSLKRNDPNFTSLGQFFLDHFGEGTVEYSDAKANFIESLAAYSMVCFLLQIKDRHNGNILLDNKGHLIHIDFGFFFLSSPGKNSGFESAPFKLTRDFVDIMDGPNSHAFRTFRELCARTFLCLRKHCYEIILLVEMLMVGNEDLNCFRGRPKDAIRELKERFRLDLNDRACHEYVNALVDESIENWRTRWYDRYQRFCVGVL